MTAEWRRPICRATIAGYPLDDEHVLYDPRSGRVYLLNQTAAYVWALCDGARTIGEIATDLAGCFAISQREALADVVDIVETLHRADLVADY